MIKCAVFDLDGTLVNTITDLGLSCDYLLKKYGYNYKWNEDDYKSFVGSGARVLIDKAFNNNLSQTELDNLLEEFKCYYDEHKLDNANIYDGVKQQLDNLKKMGVKLCVVTNKPHIAAVKMCEQLFGKDYFVCVYGNQKSLPRKPDPTSTLMAIKQCDCRTQDVLYFGDSDVDMMTANNANVKAVGVCWGYRSKAVLEKYEHYALIEKADEMSKLF